MTQFKCMICGRVDELDKSINDPRYGLVCENCHKEVDDRPVKFPHSENTCVCCGEVIPEGRQVCAICETKNAGEAIAQGIIDGINDPCHYTVPPLNIGKKKDSPELFVRSLDEVPYISHEQLKKLADEHNKIGESYVVSPKELEDALAFNKKKDAPIDIHKIIDDAMEKRDRTVSIYIGEAGVSVNVYPVDHDKCQWIFCRVPDGNGGFKGSFTCSNCGYALADIRDKGSYCGGCGELMHGIKREES